MSEPGWYPDPEDPTWSRRWDGESWTTQRRPGAGSPAQPGEPPPPLSRPPVPGSSGPPGAPPAPSPPPPQWTQSVPSYGSSTKGFFGSLFDFSFSSLIATKVIKILYVVITILVSLFALVFFIGLLTRGPAGAIFGIIIVPIAWLFYMIVARIYLELIIIIFRIGEDVRSIAERGGAPPRGYPPGL